MNQSVIRVLWPQAQQDIQAWQCECCLLSPGEQETVTLDLPAALQWAATHQQSQNMDAVVLLPGELAILNCVQLPARGQRQALQALPFVVEEQLADDIEKVHLAVGARRADGHWPVLVVDLAIMAYLADICEQTNLRLKAVYVDAQLLSINEGHISILMHDQRVLFHSTQAMAVFDLVSAASMIHLLLGETTVKHAYIAYQNQNEEQTLLAQQLSTEFSALGDTEVVLDNEATEITSLLLQVSTSTINLLQGRFTVRQPSSHLPWWQLAVAVLLLLWIGQLVLQIGSGWYFNYQADALERSAEVQYQKLFPDAKNISNPRKRLESRLLENGDSQGENSFAKLFSASVQALNALPNHDGLTIEELRYESQQGELELELKAQSIDQLDAYKQALGVLGLSGRISSANDDSEGSIVGRMQISKGL